jgi:transposase
LIPPSLEEWLPENHLARFIDEVVDDMDLDGFYAAYRDDGCGNTAYHPKMLVKLLLYSYCVGVSSSRRMEAYCIDQVAFRYLSCNQFPDHRTIGRFRRMHSTKLQEQFVHILELCKEAGLVKMGKVALDGTKLKANAALESNRDLDYLTKEVARMLAEAEATDEREDALYGKDKRGDELPEELSSKSSRLKKFKDAKKKLEDKAAERAKAHAEKLAERAAEEKTSGEKKRGRKPNPEPKETEDKINMTDEDSRIMKTRQGYVQGYNGQAMVDCESQVIVAQALTQDCNDQRQLKPMLVAVKEQSGNVPDALLADAGYCSAENVKLETEDTELFIAVQKDWKQRKALREQPTPKGRIPKRLTLVERMERKLLTKRGRATYKLRGQTVEPVFGQIKGRGDLGNLRLRGNDGATLEWSLYCSSHNLLKLWRFMLKRSRET